LQHPSQPEQYNGASCLLQGILHLEMKQRHRIGWLEMARGLPIAAGGKFIMLLQT
jgi:hypothetical protein